MILQNKVFLKIVTLIILLFTSIIFLIYESLTDDTAEYVIFLRIFLSFKEAT